MRSDLEDAMAAVIASQDASARFLEEPAAFAGEYSLDARELAMLMEMGADLTSLTASFVNKRRSTLRWNAHRTIELLGDEGEDLLDDFVETNPMPDQFKADAAAFGDYVIQETRVRATDDTDSPMIAAMARFERHRSRSFWDAIAPGRDSEQAGNLPGSVRLVAGANIGHFDWDLRLPYRHEVRPLSLLPLDPCDLLFFHGGPAALRRTLRLRPAEATVVASMPPGESVALASLAPVASDGTDVDNLCRRLSWEEAIEWW